MTRDKADIGLLPALASASEATKAFGSAEVFLEKCIVNPKHIEAQILADSFGNTVHLYERDCSIQRRNQKLIEIAPSPQLTPEQRAYIGEMAVRAAKAVGYENAGTVEFLLTGDEVYFMEMNTRVQVEHCVTEMISKRNVRKKIDFSSEEVEALKIENKDGRIVWSPEKELLTVEFTDSEIGFLKSIIEKLDKAQKDYELLRNGITNLDGNDVMDTSPTFKVLEEGAATLSKEESGRLAQRQMKFIQHLQAALVRIENKTYGICRETGKLIPKERLRAVPHATLSIEAKNEGKK